MNTPPNRARFRVLAIIKEAKTYEDELSTKKRWRNIQVNAELTQSHRDFTSICLFYNRYLTFQQNRLCNIGSPFNSTKNSKCSTWKPLPYAKPFSHFLRKKLTILTFPSTHLQFGLTTRYWQPITSPILINITEAVEWGDSRDYSVRISEQHYYWLVGYLSNSWRTKNCQISRLNRPSHSLRLNKVLLATPCSA